MTTQLHYGGVPVPYTVSWTDEEHFHVASCPHAGGRAICQAVAPGEGKPRFGKPHSQRQREAIARGLCDLCGRPLRLRTKVSLSHARPRGLGASGFAILQAEPLLHKECAAESLRHCPSLKRDIAAGTLFVRQVTRWRVQMAVMSAVYVGEIAGEPVKAIGHAKVELIAWTDRDAEWLV
jgi:hypothetical protein